MSLRFRCGELEVNRCEEHQTVGKVNGSFIDLHSHSDRSATGCDQKNSRIPGLPRRRWPDGHTVSVSVGKHSSTGEMACSRHRFGGIRADTAYRPSPRRASCLAVPTASCRGLSLARSSPPLRRFSVFRESMRSSIGLTQALFSRLSVCTNLSLLPHSAASSRTPLRHRPDDPSSTRCAGCRVLFTQLVYS